MIAFSAQMEKDMATLKEFLFNNMWRHYKVNRMTSKARRAIADLFNLFMEEVDTLPAEWQHKENVHLHELDSARVPGSSPTISLHDGPIRHDRA